MSQPGQLVDHPVVRDHLFSDMCHDKNDEDNDEDDEEDDDEDDDEDGGDDDDEDGGEDLRQGSPCRMRCWRWQNRLQPIPENEDGELGKMACQRFPSMMIMMVIVRMVGINPNGQNPK